MRRSSLTLCLFLLALASSAQVRIATDETGTGGTLSRRGASRGQGMVSADSLGTDKEIPIGLRVWTIDSYFGDRTEIEPDTLSHMYMNSIFTTGLRGEYNTTGNLGAPRINRIFIDRDDMEDFPFTQPYDFVVKPIEDFHFTNTLSPFTNLSYNTAGDRTNGEDHLTAKFGVNAGKRIGVGFKFDYLYGRGYYLNQSTSHFNYTTYGSYIGDRYQLHALASLNHQKVTENGGITDDNYITHPESFSDDYASNEIPTVLERNWNRNDNQQLFLTHRYNIGFHRKVPMTEEEIKARKFAIESKKDNDALKAKEDERKRAKREGKEFDEEAYDNRQTPSGRPDDAKIAEHEDLEERGERIEESPDRIAINSQAQLDSLNLEERGERIEERGAGEDQWMKTEYVPVTSVIHTARFDNYRRIYQAYQTPNDYYADDFYTPLTYTGDSLYDKTRHYELANTFAIAMLEGFNRWAKAGLKVFATHYLRHYTLPSLENTLDSFNENGMTLGGQISKTEGSFLHYDIMGEAGIMGSDIGEFSVDATADVNIPLFGDTLQVATTAFLHRYSPSFFLRRYQSRHFWWDNDDDFDNTIHSRIQGELTYPKTRTTLRIALDELKNYAYLGMSYNIGEEDRRTALTASPRQCTDALTVLTLQLGQDFTLRLTPHAAINWENLFTLQKTTKEEVLPLPTLNLYSNLYLRFRIARVLKCDLGLDVRYFTRYAAPDYCPALGLFAVQTGETRTSIGSYPLVNLYANFHLKQTRFFVMMSHLNEGIGNNNNYFLTPHYPLNQRIIRFGLSWNFNN